MIICNPKIYLGSNWLTVLLEHSRIFIILGRLCRSYHFYIKNDVFTHGVEVLEFSPLTSFCIGDVVISTKRMISLPMKHTCSKKSHWFTSLWSQTFGKFFLWFDFIDLTFSWRKINLEFDLGISFWKIASDEKLDLNWLIPIEKIQSLYEQSWIFLIWKWRRNSLEQISAMICSYLCSVCLVFLSFKQIELILFWFSLSSRQSVGSYLNSIVFLWFFENLKLGVTIQLSFSELYKSANCSQVIPLLFEMPSPYRLENFAFLECVRDYTRKDV